MIAGLTRNDATYNPVAVLEARDDGGTEGPGGVEGPTGVVEAPSIGSVDVSISEMIRRVQEKALFCSQFACEESQTDADGCEWSRT